MSEEDDWKGVALWHRRWEMGLVDVETSDPGDGTTVIHYKPKTDMLQVEKWLAEHKACLALVHLSAGEDPPPWFEGFLRVREKLLDRNEVVQTIVLMREGRERKQIETWKRKDKR